MSPLPAEIAVLLEKYQSGTATAADIATLRSWYHSLGTDEPVLDEHPEAVARRIRSRLLHTIDAAPRITPIHKRKYVRVAAAVLLLLTGALTYLLLGRTNETAPIAKSADHLPAVAHHIVPGGDRALLTLADGSTIVLDSASNGLIGTQGNITIKKNAQGELTYAINGKEITEQDEAFYNTITTPRGGQYQVTLADGTKVWLNAASSIRFPVVFTGGDRKVTVTGETYFEVAHDAAKPFRIKAVNTQVEVIGTHFNINAYEDEPAIRTTLVTGKVKVSGATTEDVPRILAPGQQAGINHAGRISVDAHADVEEALAWKNGRFQFRSADLKTILRQVSRWYDVDVVYRGNVDLHFTGQLTRNANVTELFEKLAMTGEVRFTIEGRKIIVSH